MMTGTEEETERIVRAKNGDRQAFGELVLIHHQSLINMLYRFCGDWTLAEDAAQEAFIRAWIKISSYHPTANFRSWLYRIATNTAIDFLRKERETSDVDDVQIMDLSKGPEDKLIKSQQSKKVREAVLRLPAASRMVLILREYEQLSYQEIAESLEIPIGTVMSRLNYARNKLKENLTEMMERS